MHPDDRNYIHCVQLYDVFRRRETKKFGFCEHWNFEGRIEEKMRVEIYFVKAVHR